MLVVYSMCFFQADDGIRDLVRSRGLGDVYKRQEQGFVTCGERRPRVAGVDDVDRAVGLLHEPGPAGAEIADRPLREGFLEGCLLYTSDAADDRSSVDLGVRRIFKKKKKRDQASHDSPRFSMLI